jgi:hypothetical protein
MNESSWSRRHFLKASTLGVAGSKHILSSMQTTDLFGERPRQAAGVAVLNPQNRVPVSFIIDDSTCLVNMAYYGIPQFHQVFPDRFVRSFGAWCRDHGVKGKYSIVPYPACTGWVDRFIPGWSKQELTDSLKLVRDFMMPDWDIHPEMISHTRVIDTRTGRPFPDATPDFMENWEWSQTKSVDELADYIGYALQILKNVGLPCEGMTTPGGFGSQNQVNLAKATLEAVRDVFNVEIPHYFRDLFTDPETSVVPRVYHAAGLEGSNPECVVSIIGCTGDWFGGWDGLTPGSVDRFITKDLQQGRLVEVIDKQEPAILVCHWPGLYYNGEEIGFNIFKEVVRRIHVRYNNLIWMKLSEIARYWAAKELTRIESEGNRTLFHAPFATPRFTVEVNSQTGQVPSLTTAGQSVALQEAKDANTLESNTWYRQGSSVMVCFDLPRGDSVLEV